jgi:hypothetical protein
MTCDTCNREFPKFLVLNGKTKDLTKRTKCLECSPFKVDRTKRAAEKSIPVDFDSKCLNCNRSYKCSKRAGHTKTRCNSCTVNIRRFEIKARAIEYKGGKCNGCGYNRCSRALVFHHRDPTKKDFALGGNHSRNWEVIQLELDKCDLLCHNCHTEEHHRLDGLK